MQNPSKAEIKEILQRSKRIAVVGLSDRPDRTSHMVSKAMQDAGYEIIPVNPTIDEALGVKAVSSLKEIDGPIDIVNVFRRSNSLWSGGRVFRDRCSRILGTARAGKRGSIPDAKRKRQNGYHGSVHKSGTRCNKIGAELQKSL